jgi:hypothetical protein
MNCVFHDTPCIKSGEGWDECKNCIQTRDLSNENNVNRVLCAVAGIREKDTKTYGSRKNSKPKWLREIQKKDPYFDIPGGVRDHIRYMDEAVISEPYNVSPEGIKDLQEMCIKYGLNFWIDGDSAHFPGKTLSITIEKKQKEDNQRDE